jgi:hypothetical protein
MTTSLPTIHSWDSNSSILEFNLLFQFLLTETIALSREDNDIEPFNIQVIDHLINLIREGTLTATKIGNHKINLMLIE